MRVIAVLFFVILGIPVAASAQRRPDAPPTPAQTTHDFEITVVELNERDPVGNASVSIIRPAYSNQGSTTSVTDSEGIARIKVTDGTRKFQGEYKITVSANHYESSTRTFTPSPDQIRPVRIEIVLIPSQGQALTFEVYDRDKLAPIRGATVLLSYPQATTASFRQTTDSEGKARFYFTQDQLKNGLEVSAQATNFEASPKQLLSDDFLNAEDRKPLRIHLKLKGGDPRFVGTWNCVCKYAITLNADGTGTFTDSRGGGEKSYSASGSFNGHWTSTGDEATFTVTKEDIPEEDKKYRAGHFTLTLKDGKLYDNYNSVLTK